MSKLIIHVTDEMKGEAKIFYKGNMMECESETVLNSVDILLGLDILEVDDIVIVKEDEIYTKLSDLLDIEDAYYDKALDDIDLDSAYEEFEIEDEEEAE